MFNLLEASPLNVGVTLEAPKTEKRVALTPEGVKTLIDRGAKVIIQSNAGMQAGYSDEQYSHAGAQIASTAADVMSGADVFLKLMVSSPEELEGMKPGSSLISFVFPATNLEVVKKLAEKEISCYAMDLIPRITRAQSMDALSSMSTIAGYKGALLAANSLPRFFPMFMTAAGTMSPAKVLVIGAGVAGLQAIATCKRLGAIVEAFDVRPAVKEQVESLGARFVSMEMKSDETQDSSGYAKEVSRDTHIMELELIKSRMVKNDVVITTALIPGRPAPVLITREMVSVMPRGSVIVDLAAPNGGNCEATVKGETVVVDGVTVIGPTELLSEMAGDASKMYAKNITEFLKNLAPEGEINMDLEDQIIRETLVTHQGKINHEPTRLLIEKGGKG